MELFYDFNGEEIPAMGDGSGLAEAMLGLDGVRVIDVSEANGEVTIEVETPEPRAWCGRGGCRAESQDRMWVDVRDLEGNAAVDLRKWTTNADPAWLAGIEVVATDLAQSLRVGLSPITRV